MNTKSSPSRIEVHESRIAPATLAGNILNYTDLNVDVAIVVFG